ncbi:hypothetical protein M8J75_004775 [Diaphorina citri]|nr:hypothetical protein M8J75_004775 [Diaphorina citri]
MYDDSIDPMNSELETQYSPPQVIARKRTPLAAIIKKATGSQQTVINYRTVESQQTVINYRTVESQQTVINYRTVESQQTVINYRTVESQQTVINYRTVEKCEKLPCVIVNVYPRPNLVDL